MSLDARRTGQRKGAGCTSRSALSPLRGRADCTPTPSRRRNGSGSWSLTTLAVLMRHRSSPNSNPQSEIGAARRSCADACCLEGSDAPVTPVPHFLVRAHSRASVTVPSFFSAPTRRCEREALPSRLFGLQIPCGVIEYKRTARHPVATGSSHVHETDPALSQSAASLARTSSAALTGLPARLRRTDTNKKWCGVRILPSRIRLGKPAVFF